MHSALPNIPSDNTARLATPLRARPQDGEPAGKNDAELPPGFAGVLRSLEKAAGGAPRAANETDELEQAISGQAPPEAADEEIAASGRPVRWFPPSGDADGDQPLQPVRPGTPDAGEIRNEGAPEIVAVPGEADNGETLTPGAPGQSDDMAGHDAAVRPGPAPAEATPHPPVAASLPEQLVGADAAPEGPAPVDPVPQGETALEADAIAPEAAEPPKDDGDPQVAAPLEPDTMRADGPAMIAETLQPVAEVAAQQQVAVVSSRTVGNGTEDASPGRAETVEPPPPQVPADGGAGIAGDGSGDAGDGEASDRSAAKPKIEVVASATFLPPVSSRSVTIDQLAGTLAEAIGEQTRPHDASSVALLSTEPDTETAQVSRRMEIELNPRDLGTVKVNLVSRGGEVSIEIVATSHRAHELLAGNKDLLAESIRHAGVTGGDITVRIASDTPANRDFQSGQNQSQQWTGSTNAGADGSAGNRRQTPDGFAQTTHRPNGDRPQEGGDSTPRRQGMYL